MAGNGSSERVSGREMPFPNGFPKRIQVSVPVVLKQKLSNFQWDFHWKLSNFQWDSVVSLTFSGTFMIVYLGFVRFSFRVEMDPSKFKWF